MIRHPIRKAIQTIERAHGHEFCGLVLDTFVSGPAFVFRGQADARWTIQSSLDRWERDHPAPGAPAAKVVEQMAKAVMEVAVAMAAAPAIRPARSIALRRSPRPSKSRPAMPALSKDKPSVSRCRSTAPPNSQ